MRTPNSYRLLVLILLPALAYWLFNLMCYHFWLGGQAIEDKEIHVRWFWGAMCLLIIAVTSWLFVLWRVIRGR